MNIHAYNDNSTLERQMITNMRTFERIIPSQPLQPYLDARPASTKYSLLPIVDPRKEINVPLIQRATYTQNTVYNPGDNAPWCGYSSSVNDESLLRNQVYALQKCSQSVYIPSSKSSLYVYKTTNNYPVEQTHKYLFKDQTFSKKPFKDSQYIGYAMFNNPTRCQMKNLTK
jgi:hypothetical protein